MERADTQTSTTADGVSHDPPATGREDESQHDPAVVVIDASSVLFSLPFGDLWRYRELLYFLAWRDVKVRYKQTALGAAWAILQPLLTMSIFALFFNRLSASWTNGVPYPLFALAGLVLWTFFANAVTNSSNSLVGSATLITKVYFPRAIIPTAAVCAALVDLLISSALLVALSVWYGYSLTPRLLLAPLFVVLTMLAALGAGMWLSALNVKYRDVRNALPFLVQIWMFASSVIVPVSLVPERLRWALYLNPMTGAVENFRAALFGSPVNWKTAAVAAAVTLALLASGLLYFQRAEETFTDIV